MKIWSRFPVFRFLIPFSAGILHCIYSDQEIVIPLIISAAAFIGSWLFTKNNYATGRYAQRWLAGIPFYTCFYAIGFCITWLHQSIHHEEHFTVNSKSDFYVVQICENPSLTAKGSKIIADVISVKNCDSWINSRGKILLNIVDTARLINFGYGDILILNGAYKEIPPPKNPGDFNYKQYIASKNTWHFINTYESNCKILKKGDPQSIFVTACRFREIMLEKLQRFISGENELGVAGALLLGYEEWLDPELENSYASAGVLHVLCVSGMHVGLIYVILAWALSWMDKKNFLRSLKYLLLLVMIWFYAMVTGFSPSVIRASAMISFIIAGKWLNKQAGIYNILCSSCILMFLMNPYLIVSAGFQLSFLAVCGIVFFHKIIFPIYTAPNKVLHHTWELISISISAQISTLPLSLYYFHQFPNYFLLGNLIIIPLSTIIMYSGLILLVIDWIPGLGWFFGTITSWGITALNNIVEYIGNIPGALTENIFINFSETILLYVLMIIVPSWLMLKYRSLFFGSLIVVVALLTSLLIQSFNFQQQSSFTIYDAYGKSHGSLIIGREAIVFTNLTTEEQMKSKIVKNHFIERSISDISTSFTGNNQVTKVTLPDGFNIVMFNGYPKNLELPDRISKPDLLVLGGKINVSLDNIITSLHPKKIIFDSSVNKYHLQKLIAECETGKIKYYSVSRSGAFQLTGKGF